MTDLLELLVKAGIAFIGLGFVFGIAILVFVIIIFIKIFKNM